MNETPLPEIPSPEPAPRGISRLPLGRGLTMVAIGVVLLVPAIRLFAAPPQEPGGLKVLDLLEPKEGQLDGMLSEWMGSDEETRRTGALIVFGTGGLFGILLGLPLVAVVGYLLLRRPPPRPLPERASWSLFDVFVIACVFVALLAVVRSLLETGDAPAPTALDLLGNAIVWGGIVLILLTWLHHVRGEGAGALGLHGRALPSSSAWGVLLWASAIPLMLGVAFIWFLLFVLADATVTTNPMAPLLAEPGESPALYIASVCTAVGLAPFAEEVLFRGFLFPALRGMLGPILAMVGSAALFAALHPLAGFYSIFLLGVLLAFVYERTGSLVAPIAMHAIHNGVAVVVSLFQSSLA